MTNVRRLSVDAAEALLALPDDEFAVVVNDDTRGRLDDERAKALRSEQVVRRWYLQLMSALRSIEGQLGSKMADYQAAVGQLRLDHAKPLEIEQEKVRYHRWRASALRVKNGLEDKLAEARALIGDTYMSEQVLLERNQALGRVSVLESAIRRHKKAALDEDGVGPDPDDVLWAVLDG